MEPTDLTIEILKGIRDGVEATNSRIDETNARLEAMGSELSRRIVESEIRTSTAITELAGTVREMTSVLRVQADLRPRVEKCERDIDDLRRRVSGT